MVITLREPRFGGEHGLNAFDIVAHCERLLAQDVELTADAAEHRWPPRRRCQTHCARKALLRFADLERTVVR